MTAYLLTSLPSRELDTNGKPVPYAKLYARAAGTLTLLPTFTDVSGMTQLSNPILADAGGHYPQIWVSGDAYDFEARKADDVSMLWQRGNVRVPQAAISDFQTAMAAATGASLVGFTAAMGAQQTSVLEFLRRRVHVFDDLTDAEKADVLAGTETLNVSPAVDKALVRLRALNGGTLVFDHWLYRLEAQHTIDFDGVQLEGTGARGTALRVHHDLGPAFIVQHATTPGADFVNAFAMRDISIRAMVETTKGCCIKLNKVQQVKFTNVQLEDHFGGLQILGGLQHEFCNFLILSPRSTGPAAWAAMKVGSFFVNVDRSSDGQIPSEIFGVNCNWRRQGDDFIERGLVINCVDGFWLDNFHIMGVADSCMRVEPTSTDRQISGIKLSNGWLDNNSDIGLHILGHTTATFATIQMTNVDCFAQRNIGIFVEDTADAFEGLQINGGSVKRSANFGILLRAGRSHTVDGGCRIAACNVNAGANAGGIVIDSGTMYPGGPGEVSIGNAYLDKSTQAFTIAAMLGIVVSAGVTTKVTAACAFDLVAADVQDSSGNEDNDYRGCKTSKAKVATSVAGGSLSLPEVGEIIYLSAGLTFANMTARRDQREVTFIAAGVSTFTHGATIITKSGADIVTAANGVYKFVRQKTAAAWLQVA